MAYSSNVSSTPRRHRSDSTAAQIEAAKGATAPLPAPPTGFTPAECEHWSVIVAQLCAAERDKATLADCVRLAKAQARCDALAGAKTAAKRAERAKVQAEILDYVSALGLAPGSRRHQRWNKARALEAQIRAQRPAPLPPGANQVDSARAAWQDPIATKDGRFDASGKWIALEDESWETDERQAVIAWQEDDANLLAHAGAPCYAERAEKRYFAASAAHMLDAWEKHKAEYEARHGEARATKQIGGDGFKSGGPASEAFNSDYRAGKFGDAWDEIQTKSTHRAPARRQSSLTPAIGALHE